MNDEPVIRSRPGPRPAPDEAADAGMRPTGTDMLERVRKAATDWRNAQVALLGLITVVSVVKGQDSIRSLSGPAQVWVGLLLLAALVCAGTGTYLVAEIAYGLPRVSARFRTGNREAPKAVDDTALAVRGTRRLRAGLVFTFVALGLMTAAVGVTWYGPSAAKLNVKIETTQGTTTCGEFVSGGSEMLLVSTGQGRASVPVDTIVTVTPTATC